jgi:hypothetical protein
VITKVPKHDVHAVLAFGRGPFQSLAAQIGGAYVTKINKFFFVADIVVKRCIRQSQHVGDISERRAAVALLIEALRCRLEHASFLQLESGFFSVFRHGAINPLGTSSRKVISSATMCIILIQIKIITTRKAIDF